ncbi:50S ribosomal protein L10 [Candidatus Shapirobacteria bacterium]|nr:50S ribosomal protein L10 [Candidatus Shapirobacteria bacterium]
MEKMVNQNKVRQVEDLGRKIEEAKSFFLVDFNGVKAGLMNRLRREAKNSGGDFLVVKNSLLNRALAERGIKLGEERSLTGPTACIFGHEKEIEALKKVSEALRGEGVGANFKGGALLSKEEPLVLKGEEVGRLANLPTFEELIGKTILGIEGPLVKMQLVLSKLLGDFILVLKEINRKEEIKGGEN